MKFLYLIILLSCTLSSCKRTVPNSPVDLFSITHKLSELKSNISDDSIGVIEGMQCDDSILLIFDYHLGKSFTLFNSRQEKYIGRFGLIGQGPGEIPLGCNGNIAKRKFDIFYDQTGLIAAYNIDSLILNIDAKPEVLMKYRIPEALFSKVIAVNDTLFLGAGTYKSKYQFVLFDRNSKVLDYGVEIFNSQDDDNMYHKYLSNQGSLAKSPIRNQYVYSINNSSNIDFINITSDNQIELVKSIRLKNPQYKVITKGGLHAVIPDENNGIGYIDLAVSDQYVYALYTDHTIVDKKTDKSNAISSNLVLVFDWEGNPVKSYVLSKAVYFIALDECSNKLYGATIKEDGGWSVISYAI